MPIALPPTPNDDGTIYYDALAAQPSAPGHATVALDASLRVNGSMSARVVALALRQHANAARALYMERDQHVASLVLDDLARSLARLTRSGVGDRSAAVFLTACGLTLDIPED